MVLRLRPSAVYTTYWAIHPPFLRRVMLPSPLPRLATSAPRLHELLRLHPESPGELPDCRGVCLAVAILEPPDGVLRDTRLLRQFPQREHVLAAQRLEPFHIHLHVR